MSDPLKQALSNPGPHTTRSLAAHLPDFPEVAIREALEMLAAQGVIAREVGPDGEPEYRYVAPEKYGQIHLDVIRNPGDRHNRQNRGPR